MLIRYVEFRGFRYLLKLASALFPQCSFSGLVWSHSELWSLLPPFPCSQPQPHHSCYDILYPRGPSSNAMWHHNIPLKIFCPLFNAITQEQQPHRWAKAYNHKGVILVYHSQGLVLVDSTSKDSVNHKSLYVVAILNNSYLMTLSDKAGLDHTLTRYFYPPLVLISFIFYFI